MKLQRSFNKPPPFQSRKGLDSSRNGELDSGTVAFRNSNLDFHTKEPKMEPEELLEYPAKFKRLRTVENAQQLQATSVDDRHMLPPAETMLQSSENAISTSHFSALIEPRPLGLILRKSPSLLDLIQKRLAQNDDSGIKPWECSPEKREAVLQGCEKNKLKAANVLASFLRIGSWECTSRYDGDLVAKCYYAKRKLVWEILDHGLKSKMEIQWSDISALKAEFPEGQQAILDIELSRPPLFFKEIKPQPRKHTLWQSTSDFTEGQATVCRHHLLQFPVGVLNHHFEKLLQCDARLRLLSACGHAIKDSCFFPQLKMHDAPQMVHYQSLFSENLTVVEPLVPTDTHVLVSDCFMPDGYLYAIPDVHEVSQFRHNLIMESSSFSKSPSSVIDVKNVNESSSKGKEMSLKERSPYEAVNLNMLERSCNLGSRPTRQIAEWDDSLTCESCTNRGNVSSQVALDKLSLHLLGEHVSSSKQHAQMLVKGAYHERFGIHDNVFSMMLGNHWNFVPEI